MEKVDSQIESHILKGSPNDEKGSTVQLAKRQIDNFLEEDFTANEENELNY